MQHPMQPPPFLNHTSTTRISPKENSFTITFSYHLYSETHLFSNYLATRPSFPLHDEAVDGFAKSADFPTHQTTSSNPTLNSLGHTEHNEWPYIKLRNLKKHVSDWWKFWQWVQKNWCYNAPVLVPGFKGRNHLMQVLKALTKFEEGLMRVKPMGKKIVAEVAGKIKTWEHILLIEGLRHGARWKAERKIEALEKELQGRDGKEVYIVDRDRWVWENEWGALLEIDEKVEEMVEMVEQWRVMVQQNTQGKWKYDIPPEDAAEFRKAGWEDTLDSVY